MKINHFEIMDSLKSKFEEIAELIGSSSIHYVDIPVHANVGDLLIMSGTLEFFNINKIKVKSISSCFNFSTDWVLPGDTVVFHGGGNLGGLYDGKHGGPQTIRENVIKKLKNNKIIILPQTVCFPNEEKKKECIEIFSQHKDLHIFLRDEESFKKMSNYSMNLYLKPDMAHNLWPLNKKEILSSGTMGLIRTDKESRGNKIPNESLNEITDWPEFIGYRNIYPWILVRLMWIFNKTSINSMFISNVLSNLWIAIARSLINRSIFKFSKFNTVYTDRLHGHILSCLLNINNVVYDNNYGKNSTYINAWTKNSDKVETNF